MMVYLWYCLNNLRQQHQRKLSQVSSYLDNRIISYWIEKQNRLIGFYY